MAELNNGICHFIEMELKYRKKNLLLVTKLYQSTSSTGHNQSCLFTSVLDIKRSRCSVEENALPLLHLESFTILLYLTVECKVIFMVILNIFIGTVLCWSLLHGIKYRKIYIRPVFYHIWRCADNIRTPLLNG